MPIVSHAARKTFQIRSLMFQTAVTRGNNINHEDVSCRGCDQRIRDRYFLNCLGYNWHEDCLKCTCCAARLGEVGASLFQKANLLLCKRDYLRIFGSTGLCAACNKTIPAFEMVMRAKHNVYHLECFACQFCGHRFCVGDRFSLWNNKILCENNCIHKTKICNSINPVPSFSSSGASDLNNNGALPKRNSIVSIS